jgi:uncharacterized SAM-binding protein YcdF (DUF218 family)
MESKAKTLSTASPGGPPPNGNAAVVNDTGHGSTRFVTSAQRTRRWWRRGLVPILILGTCLYLFRAPILQSVAAYLVVDERGPADYVLILDGDGRYDRAASLYHSGSATRILLVESRPKRLERMGFRPSYITLSQRELAARGVPQDAVTVIPGQSRTDWDRARRLREWLQQQPAMSIVVLCNRFGGRRLRYIFDEILGADYAGRVRVSALPERGFGESDWWQNRQATVYVFDSYLRLAYDRLSGEDSEEWREWDPQEYSKKLR